MRHFSWLGEQGPGTAVRAHNGKVFCVCGTHEERLPFSLSIISPGSISFPFVNSIILLKRQKNTWFSFSFQEFSWFFFSFEAESHYISQAGLKLRIFPCPYSVKTVSKYHSTWLLSMVFISIFLSYCVPIS